ncbi:MAG: hypothetical protein ACPGWR_33960, partial [Ardenticatenaceae bacterium]
CVFAQRAPDEELRNLPTYSFRNPKSEIRNPKFFLRVLDRLKHYMYFTFYWRTAKLAHAPRALALAAAIPFVSAKVI